MKLSPQYVVNERGERTGVILSPEEYRQLLDALEDRLDAEDLDEAAQQETEFIPYSRVREQLKDVVRD